MKRGQLCSNCAGDCCTLAGKGPVGSWIIQHMRQVRYSSVLRHGAYLSEEVREDHRCFKQLQDGGCSDYEHRPPLCKSFFCYGRLWRPKPEVKKVNVPFRREQLKRFCLSQLEKLFDAGNFDRFAELLERGDGPFNINFKLVLPPDAVWRIKEMK